MSKLEKFISTNARAFYRLPASTKEVILRKRNWAVASLVELPKNQFVRPLFFGNDSATQRWIEWHYA